MKPERPTSLPWLHGVRTTPAQPTPPWRRRRQRSTSPADQTRTFGWRRLTRSRRGAVGLVIAVAALLLAPFSGWSWIPWAAGLGLLVLLRLLRLDGLLRGWVLHLGGVVVVVGLMYSTGPWAWALAASLGVLLAGLAQLPWWKLAAVGAVLCVVSGVGFGYASYRSGRQIAAEQAQTQLEGRGTQGAYRVANVLPTMLTRIAQNVPGPICENFLAGPALTAFVASTGQADCPAAVAHLASQVVDPDRYPRAVAPTSTGTDRSIVDACAMTWSSGGQAGPQLGTLTIGRKDGGTTWVVTGFAACPP
jgi:hypothetical protein